MLFISMGIFDDKLHPQILAVDTTANSPLSCLMLYVSFYNTEIYINLAQIVRALDLVIFIPAFWRWRPALHGF